MMRLSIAGPRILNSLPGLFPGHRIISDASVSSALELPSCTKPSFISDCYRCLELEDIMRRPTNQKVLRHLGTQIPLRASGKFWTLFSNNTGVYIYSTIYIRF